MKVNTYETKKLGEAGCSIQRARDLQTKPNHFSFNVTKFRNKFSHKSYIFHTQRHIANARTLTVKIFLFYMINFALASSYHSFSLMLLFLSNFLITSMANIAVNVTINHYYIILFSPVYRKLPSSWKNEVGKKYIKSEEKKKK